MTKPGATAATASDLASREEVEAAAEALSTADLNRLREYARHRLAGLTEGRTWEDLLGEAMVRVLDGDRRWRKSVPFVKYLCGVMRSVASHWDEAADPALPASSLAYEDEEGEQLDPVTAAAGKEPDAEHVTLGRETLDVLVSHFENDEVASLLIMGLSEYRVSELPEMLGIAPEKCAAGMKRLRRHARALIDRGGRP